MKGLYTVISILLTCTCLCAQERTISGVLTSSDDGSPLAGVNIHIKGTSIGTTTDANGYYSIRVPVGSILVFSFIGMQSKEVLVTADKVTTIKKPDPSTKHPSSREREQKPLPPSFLSDSIGKNSKGIAYLTNKTPTYKTASRLIPSEIHRIRWTGKHFVVHQADAFYQRTDWGALVSSSFSVDRAGRTPPVQNQYAQGRSTKNGLMWFGHEQDEHFSWGPKINSLELAGDQHSPSPDGTLVPVGTGSGIPARSFDNNILRSGVTWHNAILISAPVFRSGTLLLDVDHSSRTGIIPGSSYNRYNVSSKTKNIKISRTLSMNTGLWYHQSNGILLNRGSNLATIFGNMWLTPPTFDNANGESRKTVYKNDAAWKNIDGSMRSFAPNQIDNPYALISRLPDREEMKRYAANVNLSYRNDQSGRFSLNASANADQQNNQIINGVPATFNSYPKGRQTRKEEEQLTAHALVAPSWTWYNYHQWKIYGTYSAQYAKRQVLRADEFGMPSEPGLVPDSAIYTRIQRTRLTNEISVAALFQNNQWLMVRVSNGAYFSNTASHRSYRNLFPAASISITPDLYAHPLDRLNVYGTFSRTLREADLFYNDWSWASLSLAPKEYRRAFEYVELPFQHGLRPQSELKIEAGIKTDWFNRVNFTVLHFTNKTSDYIVPVTSQKNTRLDNVGAITNQGVTATLDYRHPYNHKHRLHWSHSLSWTRYTTVATKVYADQDFVPLAGFTTIQTRFVKGQPVGAIYGTTFFRDENGKVVIGGDGFPLVQTELVRIGNPIPDWTLSWSANLAWKRFSLSFLMDFKKGGEAWNGTRAALDYHGTSASSSKARSVSDFIFSGVTIEGEVNDKQVAFHDGDSDINANRWVRYGWEGVGEEYIEDTSWIRLNDATLTYLITPPVKRFIKSVKLGLTGKNLFLITPYSGVDPASTLFGYNAAKGLDLFNGPATRTYNFHITIKL